MVDMNKIKPIFARISIRILCIGMIFLFLCSSPANATELINDGWSDGQPAFFQDGFISGEIGASRFVPDGPCPCFVSQVSLLYGGDNQTRTVRLHIWEDGAGTADPGPEIFTGDYELQGSNTAIQLIDLSLNGIVVSGPFRVGIEFFDDGFPAIAADTDGNIQANTNFILASGLLWVDPGIFGVTGDWIIRATIEEQGELVDELKNDSWPPSLVAHFQQGFVAGETAAVRMTPVGPCPCSVDGVSVLIGGAPGFADIGLRIWDDSALTDDPGALLYTHDFLDLPAANATLNIIPLSQELISVSGPFRVGFELLNAGLPSVARDDDGITAGVNFIDEDTLGWQESSTLGLTGDWITRAVVTNQNQETLALGHDNWDALELPAFQDGFLAGEIAAVRLEPDIPCPCLIQGVRLMFGGAVGNAGVTLRIWEDGGLVTPGAELFSIPLILDANDVALNAIDLSSTPVLVNGPFRVGIEFDSAGAPSVARDHDGTVPGRNFIYTDGATWVDSTSEAVPGDWIIRASIIPEIVLSSSFE
jgi:hypothetical protein